MPFSIRTLSIMVTSVLAVLLIGAAFWLSGPVSFGTKTATARDMQALLAEYAERDTDADGLTDWQETLYKTDPRNPHSVDATRTDGEAVAQGLIAPKFESHPPPEEIDVGALPGALPASQSLTDSFARQFLEQYLESTGGQPMTELEQQAFVSFLMNELSRKVAQTLASTHTARSLSQSASMDVLTYVNNVESMITTHGLPPDGSSFLSLTQALIERGDSSARTGILRRAVMYERLTDASLRLIAPASLADAHLQMVRSFDTLARLMRAVASFEEDPIVIPAALSLYVPTGYDSLTAMRAMIAAAKANGGAIPGKPGMILAHTIGETP